MIKTIPEAFLNHLPINPAIVPLHGDYQQMKEVVQLDNKSYERNQKLESKRQLEESICQVVGKPEELSSAIPVKIDDQQMDFVQPQLE